jgi:hypothetical protein
LFICLFVYLFKLFTRLTGEFLKEQDKQITSTKSFMRLPCPWYASTP